MLTTFWLSLKFMTSLTLMLVRPLSGHGPKRAREMQDPKRHHAQQKVLPGNRPMIRERQCTLPHQSIWRARVKYLIPNYWGSTIGRQHVDAAQITIPIASGVSSFLSRMGASTGGTMPSAFFRDLPRWECIRA